MKCNYCGTNFEGKFCPGCGARAEVPETPADVETTATAKKKTKMKKPFYLRWWFILLVIIAVVSVAGKMRNRINWNDIVLNDMIPSPPSKSGNVYTNSDEKLRVSLKEVSDAQYNRYLDTCARKGFAIDVVKSSSSYEAYNEDGWHLDLSHYGKSLNINLDAPLAMGRITWPGGIAGSILPTPQSDTGRFEFEYEDRFLVYVGNTTKADYDAYVAACSDYGFNVDYSKGDTHYYAYNEEDWYLSLKYKGNSTMSIQISAPSEVEETQIQAALETTATIAEEIPETTQPNTEEATIATEAASLSTASGIRPEFKEAMDAYETFYNEYCDFMVNYQKNPTDLKLITQYGQLMAKMVDVNEAFEKWDESDLNNEELKYYLEVNGRVMQKLVDVTGE